MVSMERVFSSEDVEVVWRVQALAPNFRERVPVTETQRSVPRESIDELLQAGMARMLVPAEYGGVDGKLHDLVLATAAAAYGCPSTGWIASLMAHSAHTVGMFPVEAQDAVWADGPDVIFAGSTAPSGRAEKVPGGYRISGRHAFSSGVNNADWSYVGGMVTAEAGPPEWRFFMLNKNQYKVEDVWHTAGMRGTGSNTIVVEDVFVPEAHTLSQVDAREGTGPGAHHNADAKFRLPWVTYATVGFTATMLGAAQGAYDNLCATLAKKRTPAGELAAEGQIIQVDITFAAARIDAARNIILGIADRADSGKEFTLLDRATVGRDNTLASMLLVEAIDTLLRLSSTSGFAQTSFVQQAWRDIHFAAAHTSVNRVEFGTRYGRMALGIGEPDLNGFF